MLFILASCSHLEEASLYERYPADAGDATCDSLAKNLFLTETYKEDLQKALVSKKLLTFSNKYVTVQHPRLDWINKTKISLNKSLKNWNSNKYPAFYIFNDEDIVPHAKQYFQTVNSMVNPDIAVMPEATKNLEVVSSWIQAFTSYKKDIDQLLEERISLQYNLSLLKKLKLKDDIQDIKLSIKRNGEFVEEIITLRKSDKDLAYQIKKLKSEISALDGSLLKNGKIKDRMIRQAALDDMLTILQREFEYGLKNMDAPNPELIKEMNKINMLLASAEFRPATYGIYRITNKVFMREVLLLSKVDVAYKKFVGAPLDKLKEIVKAFIENRAANGGTTAEKIGIFKRIYAKITSITPKQAITGTGAVALTGIGVERYFSLEEKKIVELEATHDQPHEEQLERTKEEEVRKSDAHSEVIEVHIDELTKP